MGQILPDGLSDNDSFGLVPADASTQPVQFQPQKSPQGQQDVIALGACSWCTWAWATPQHCFSPR
jgi:hypothetical protein